MRKYIPAICDALLAAVCVFLLFFTLIRYYFDAAAGLAAGIVCGLAAGAGAYFLIMARRSRADGITEGRAEAQKLAVHLAILGEEGANKLLADCLYGARLDGQFILKDGALYLACFKAEPVTADCLLPLVRREGEKKYFVCSSATQSCADFAAATRIELLRADDVYKIFKEAGKLPEKYLFEGKKRTKFFALVRSRFTRKLCLPAFWSGAALLFFSYFTYYPIYYIVSGSLLLLLCCLAALFGKRKSA